MGKTVVYGDRLSRIVCDTNRKSYCRVSENEVKPKAFKPNKKNETSIFVTSGLAENEIWHLGEFHLCGENKVYGRADVNADVIFGLKKLKIDYNNKPEYHANFLWPDDKEDIQDIAQVIAAEADCVKR
ncbi:hypothetical protein MNBD_GAMMA21-1347 [hydrothermal vent metagenome]|uniref:Uncharacterized protein n=1 Tax=hydrothermal vent metagenome TaxID=652676 RepID=A0A3B0ZWP5_9ZZZZ